MFATPQLLKAIDNGNTVSKVYNCSFCAYYRIFILKIPIVCSNHTSKIHYDKKRKPLVLIYLVTRFTASYKNIKTRFGVTLDKDAMVKNNVIRSRMKLQLNSLSGKLVPIKDLHIKKYIARTHDWYKLFAWHIKGIINLRHENCD